MTTVFHLVRHADHDRLGSVLTGRAAGVHLSERGRAQARTLALHFSKGGLDALRTSPQPRAQETAAPIAAELGLACGTSPELDEIDFGRWVGQPFDMLDTDPAWKRWNVDRDSTATAGGETMRDVATRLVRLIDELRRDFPGGAVGLVSRGDVIKAGVCHYLGLPFQGVHRFEISPTSITTIAVGDWGGKLLALNDLGSSKQPEAMA